MKKIVSVQLLLVNYEILLTEEDIDILKKQISQNDVYWILIKQKDISFIFKKGDILYIKIDKKVKHSKSYNLELQIWFSENNFLSVEYNNSDVDFDFLKLVKANQFFIKTDLSEWIINTKHIRSMFTRLNENIEKQELFNDVIITAVDSENKNNTE